MNVSSIPTNAMAPVTMSHAFWSPPRDVTTVNMKVERMNCVTNWPVFAQM